MTIKHLYPTSTPSLNLDFSNSNFADSRITTTRASTATYVDQVSGLIKTAPANVARVEKDGLLIEESRTNIIERSQELDNTTDYPQTTGVSVSANSTVAPDGTTTADTYNTTAGNQFQTKFITVSSSTNYTGSFFIKKTTSASYQCGIYLYFGVNNLYIFRLNTDDGTTSGYSGSYPLPTNLVVEDYNDYWRVSFTGSSGSYTTVRIFIYANFSSAGAVAAGSQVLWGFQLEAGDFSTSYIPTSGSTVTRAADACAITGTNFSSWYKQSEGTIQVKYSSPTDTSSPYKRLVSISDSSQNTMSANTGFLYGSHSPSTSTRWMARNGTSIWYAGLASPASLSSAIAYQDDNLAISYDGATVLTNTNFTVSSMSSLPSRLDFYFNGTISRLAYYSTRVNNSQLQTLTQ